MRAQPVTETTDILETALANPPEDRSLDVFWGGDEVDGPTQWPLAWRIALRGGTLSALAADLVVSAGQLRSARQDLEIATARLLPTRDEIAHRIVGLEKRIKQLTVVVEAGGARVETDSIGTVRVTGGWIAVDMRALQAAVGRAEHLLREACGRVDPYREQWPPIKDFAKRFAVEIAEAEQAKAGLRAAMKAEADCLAPLTADREELRKLRARRVA